ncbi:carbohydrate ABC transporter permease [Euzebya sp.]|uniref:carbohydrate ABC transporter permease n=1 Tax=Euzebya sp. TaxID=1971409 RepID=UPI0035167165
MLCAPAVFVMVLVTGYPILYAGWLSLQEYDLRFPDEASFVGFANYISVLTSSTWWDVVLATVIITVASVTVELILGFALAFVMHRALFGRGVVRASILIPYGIITVVAALAWKFAFDPSTGFVNPLLGIDQIWFGETWSAFFVIILTEIWKTTPFMALLLLAGLTLVPADLLKAAQVDGATAWKRFTRITLPMMKPAVLVALLFRTLDAFRIFDAVYVMTRGARGTETVSVTGYETLVIRLNLGLGSAISVLMFLMVLLIAFLFVKGFGANLDQQRGEI